MLTKIKSESEEEPLGDEQEVKEQTVTESLLQTL